MQSRYVVALQRSFIHIKSAEAQLRTYRLIPHLTLSGLKTLRFLRNFVLNIPIARVPGRNPFAKEWWAAILAFQQAPQAFKGF
ncbi:MAG: hypothetical protein EAZ23_04255 [Oscillatoriales cyanobacterium]|nr:MAG: hypothetical protein EAZ23_04255 [Oscillatoriales cyanobacterium]